MIAMEKCENENNGEGPGLMRCASEATETWLDCCEGCVEP